MKNAPAASAICVCVEKRFLDLEPRCGLTQFGRAAIPTELHAIPSRSDKWDCGNASPAGVIKIVAAAAQLSEMMKGLEKVAKMWVESDYFAAWSHFLCADTAVCFVVALSLLFVANAKGALYVGRC
jgi:hypothetical protein